MREPVHAMVVTALSVLMLVLADMSLTAQNHRAPSRIAVTVALSNEGTQVSSPFVILRRAGGTPRDVILLRDDVASAQILSQAIFMLAAARREEGDTAQAPHRLRGTVVKSSREAARELPWANRVLADLRVKDSLPVPGVGRTRAIEIWLPPQHRRGNHQGKP